MHQSWCWFMMFYLCNILNVSLMSPFTVWTFHCFVEVILLEISISKDSILTCRLSISSRRVVTAWCSVACAALSPVSSSTPSASVARTGLGSPMGSWPGDAERIPRRGNTFLSLKLCGWLGRLLWASLPNTLGMGRGWVAMIDVRRLRVAGP